VNLCVDVVLAEDCVAPRHIVGAAPGYATEPATECDSARVACRTIGVGGAADDACRTGLTNIELTTLSGLFGHRSEGRKWIAWC